MSIEEKINQAQGAVKESVGKLSGNKKNRKRRGCRKSSCKSQRSC